MIIWWRAIEYGHEFWVKGDMGTGHYMKILKICLELLVQFVWATTPLVLLFKYVCDLLTLPQEKIPVENFQYGKWDNSNWFQLVYQIPTGLNQSV